MTKEVYPREAEWFAQVRVRQAADRAGILVTACPRCEESLSQGARSAAVGIQVQDISDFLIKAADI